MEVSDLQESRSARARIYLLSPANAKGARARLLMNPRRTSEMAARLSREGVGLGEIFSFISGLYFRGKLAYAQAFAAPPPGAPGLLVITACGGLVAPHTVFTRDALRKIIKGEVHATSLRYRKPLERDALRLAQQAGDDCDVILLGSIATPKYTEPLRKVFGPRLLFPAEFVGRGDMSRGGLLLRCVREGVRLNYVPVEGAMLHGAKPPKLAPLPRRAAATVVG